MTKRVSIHSSRKEGSAQSTKQAVTVPDQQQLVAKLLTSQEQILQSYPDLFEGIGCFLGSPYHIPFDQSITPKQTPGRSILVHLKEALKQEIDKMLKVGVLKPVHEVNPRINSFVLVEGKDKLGNLKPMICLDPTNLNKAIVREPYHFKTPEDIAHLLVDACIMSVCDCKKGYWHQQLDEASPFLTSFNTELGLYRYTVMPFRATMAGDVSQCKLDQCFGHIQKVIAIADYIMIVVRKPNYSGHDQALAALLETARKCNVQLNYEKLQYKKQEVYFFQ